MFSFLRVIIRDRCVDLLERFVPFLNSHSRIRGARSAHESVAFGDVFDEARVVARLRTAGICVVSSGLPYAAVIPELTHGATIVQW